MIEPVERKIGQINAQKKKALKKQREENLARWGFDGKKKNKNDIPLILTDDEYEAVLEAEKEYSSVAKTDKNLMANILFAFGIAMLVIGVVAGIVFYQIATDIGFVYLTISIVVGVAVAVLFFGLSEAIKLLQQLVDRN
ncbi:MAG: hypothetical protein ACI4GA_03075 [Acutalibacteraceae bacterium]|nr:hypothetical protein [Oscillospiraceae bacterium]